MAYLRQLENKVLGNLKQATEKDLVEWMGEHKYVKEEVRGVKLVVENEKSEKTQRRRGKKDLIENCNEVYIQCDYRFLIKSERQISLYIAL